MAKSRRYGGIQNAIFIGGGTFFLAVALTYVSQSLVSQLTSLVVSLSVLLMIIATGVLADIIGVAVAVASEAPFHAKAACKVKGAKQALFLTRHAGQVASFFNDVVGDVAGTLSGAIGAAVVFIFLRQGGWSGVVASTLVTGLVAAITVGGKAWGKGFALERAEDIVFAVGKVMAWLDRNQKNS